MRRTSLVQRAVSTLAAVTVATGGFTAAGWIIAPSAFAAAATYYASPNGAGDCSSPAQACTLATAVGLPALADDDIVKLEPGPYVIENVVVLKSITIEPDGAFTPELDAGQGGVILTIGKTDASVSPSVHVNGMKFAEYGIYGIDCKPAASCYVDQSTFETPDYARGIATESGKSDSTKLLSVTDSIFDQGDNGIGIINGAGASTTVTVDGSTFTTTSDEDEAHGAGISNAYVGSITVSDSTFDTTVDGGLDVEASGILNVETGEVHVSGSTFDTAVEETADEGEAWGIRSEDDGLVDVSSSSFDTTIAPGENSNSTVAGIGACTCGAVAEGGTLTVDGSSFDTETEPVADGYGGVADGIDATGSGAVTDSTFTSYAGASASEVSDVFAEGDQFTIDDSDLDTGVGAVCGCSSGGIAVAVADATALGTTITNSTVVADGTDESALLVAGVVNATSRATIEDSTISASGQAIALSAGVPPQLFVPLDGSFNVLNSTITGDGGEDSVGIALWGASTATVEQSTITRTGVGVDVVFQGTANLGADIVAGNVTNCVDINGAINDEGYNISDDDSCLFVAPSVSNSATIVGSLAPLADNGGPTQTVGLFAGSPAHDLVAGDFVDEIDNSTACVNPDQRGVARPGADETCDAGAFQGTVVPTSNGGGNEGGNGGGSQLPPPSIVVTSSDVSSVPDEPVTFTGTISPGPTCGTVTWLVDNTAKGSPIPVSQGASGPGGLSFTLGPIANLAIGSHPVTLVFSGCPPLGGGSGELVQVVAKGDTATTVTVNGSTFTATVKPIAPATGTPTGTVTFFVDGSPAGTAPLGSDGTATSGGSTPATSAASARVATAQNVSATYSGDARFNGSSSSAAGTGGIAPTIKAHRSSKHHKTKAGWYRGPVTITFTCTVGSAPLVDPGCPAPVTLRHSGAAQSVTGVVHAVDGGSASVTVSPINIDRTPPTDVRVKGSTYPISGLPGSHGCTATDDLSGVKSCTLHRKLVRVPGFLEVRLTMTAVNNAGGKRTVHQTLRLPR